MQCNLVKYDKAWKEAWNEAVEQARQSSFLFLRDFMDYHKERFADRSLLIFDTHGQLLALLPACIDPHCPRRILSHGGLTYGGLLLLPRATTVLVGEIMQSIISHYAAEGFTEMIYKPLPYIYHQYPAEEDLYWLFRFGARLTGRTVSSAISLPHPYPLSTLRQRKVRKASRTEALRIDDSTTHLPEFWQMLQAVLQERHHVNPVHSLSELRLLADRFPRQIRLLTVHLSADEHPADAPNHIVAGSLLFITSTVAHVQYIAANDEGCRLSALDWLFSQLPTWLSHHAPEAKYLDFGISTEQGGNYLNEGLIFQKEGFGARAVCYDLYTLPLTFSGSSHLQVSAQS